MNFSTELYNKYIEEYKFLHNDPWFKKNGYIYGYGDGKIIVDSFPLIKQMIINHKANSILDYGCGKAVGHKIKNIFDTINIKDIGLYDPAVKEFNKLPTKQFDGVICAYVMEHIPEENIDYELDRILKFANKFAFFTINCNPAKHTLRTGENSHITLHEPGWWVKKLKKFEQISIYVKFSLNKQKIFTNIKTGDIRYV